MNVAIMQPCYLPWRGYFALMKACDVFVHLNDAMLPQGRTVQTRVAMKTARGRQWLSLPIRRQTGIRICDAALADDHWRRKHLATLRQELPQSVDIVADLYARPWRFAADLSIALAIRMGEALKIHRPSIASSEMGIHETGSDRILSICRSAGGTRYVTGHGGRNYLDHAAFERSGIEVLYLDYDLSPYPQPHGEFDPYVTALDAIAHAADPCACMNASLVPCRDFLTRTPNGADRRCGLAGGHSHSIDDEILSS